MRIVWFDKLTELRILVNEIQHPLKADLILWQENTDPSQDHLSMNPEVKGVQEIEGYESFYGTWIALVWTPVSYMRGKCKAYGADLSS